MLKTTLALVGLTLSLSANAVIVNTLGGVNYQWLELSHTLGLGSARSMSLIGLSPFLHWRPELDC